MFTKLYFEAAPGEFQEWDHAVPMAQGEDMVRLPPNIGDLWPDQELADLSTPLFKAAEADPAPEGFRRVGNPSLFRGEDGLLRFGFEIEPIPPPVISPAQVDAEGIRRISAGFIFNGKTFDNNEKSSARIAGSSTLALIALTLGGKQPGDLRWASPDGDFGWIVKDNTIMPLDAPGMIGLGQAAALWEEAHVKAGRALKDMEPIPLDFEDDIYWPEEAA